jgi:hypothetical protein
MSSLLRFYSTPAKPPTKFFDILTGSYEDDYVINGNSVSMPIPYTVLNQTLDINVDQSPDAAAFVTDGDTPSTGVAFQGKVMGGGVLVLKLGTNMTTYLRNRITSAEGLGSQYSGSLTIYINPVMTKVQMAAPAQGNDPLNDESVYGITTEPPVSTEFIGGSLSNNFFTAWVFKSPLTIQYEASTGNKYMTFTSQFSAN